MLFRIKDTWYIKEKNCIIPPLANVVGSLAHVIACARLTYVNLKVYPLMTGDYPNGF